MSKKKKQPEKKIEIMKERKLSSKHEDQIEHISEDCKSFEWGLDEDCTCGGLTVREKTLKEKKP